MSLSDRLFCNHHAHPLRQAWSYRLRCAKEMFVWFKSRLNPWYISIASNPNLCSTKIIMKMRWQTIASSVSMRTISPTATPLPTAYDCVAVYIAGRRTNLVVYGCRPKPTTKKHFILPVMLKLKKANIKRQSSAHCNVDCTLSLMLLEKHQNLTYLFINISCVNKGVDIFFLKGVNTNVW